MQHSKSYNRDKSPLYENEIPYQMVSSIAQKYLGNYYEDKFFEYGLIIIKPEALIMGKVDEIFSIFCTRGYELVYFTRKKIDAMCTAEMWKFSWQNFRKYSYKSKTSFYVRFNNIDFAIT